MLCVWVHGCDPGRVSDGSRLVLCHTLSIECPSPIFFWHVLCVIVPFFLSFLSCFILFFVLILQIMYYIVFGWFWLWSVLLRCFFWCPCMAINVSVQYILADIILLTQMLLPSENPFKCHEEVLSLQPMIPPTN